MISTGQDLAGNLSSLAVIVVAALAVRQDLIEHRIPNLLTFTALVVGLLIHSSSNGLDGFIHALAGAGVGLACLLPLYLLKGMGAGDVKLMAALGAFLGPLDAFLAAAMTLVFGALLAVAVILWRVIESRATVASTPATMMSVCKERFPYAVAIGLGAVATLWQRGMLDALFYGLASG